MVYSRSGSRRQPQATTIVQLQPYRHSWVHQYSYSPTGVAVYTRDITSLSPNIDQVRTLLWDSLYRITWWLQYYIRITINSIYSLQDIITTSIQVPNVTSLQMRCTTIWTDIITPDLHERRHFLHINTIQSQFYMSSTTDSTYN